MESSEIRIRRANVSDVDIIVRLANNGGPDGSPKLSLPSVLPEEYYQAFERINNDPSHFLMVAEVRGEVVGTIHMTFLIYLAGGGKDDLQVEAKVGLYSFHTIIGTQSL